MLVVWSSSTTSELATVHTQCMVSLHAYAYGWLRSVDENVFVQPAYGRR